MSESIFKFLVFIYLYVCAMEFRELNLFYVSVLFHLTSCISEIEPDYH